MSDYERRSRRSRRGDDGYRNDDAGARRSYEQEAPYDALYKRSFEPVPDDQQSTRSSGRSRRHGHHDSYEDDAAKYKENRDQKQVGRLRDDVDQQGSYAGRNGGRRSHEDYDDYEDETQPSRDDGTEDEQKERLSGWCGKERKDIAATLIGAAAGAFLGHEAGKGQPIRTLGGAVLGGLSANAIEHRHLKHEETRNEENERRSSRQNGNRS